MYPCNTPGKPHANRLLPPADTSVRGTAGHLLPVKSRRIMLLILALQGGIIFLCEELLWAVCLTSHMITDLSADRSSLFTTAS